MNRLLIVLLVLISVPCMAQFTVTQSNFPRQATFVDTVLSSNEAGIPLPTEGANQVWDYSNLNTNNTTVTVHTDATANPVFTDALNSYQDDVDFMGLAVPVTIFEAIDPSGFHFDGQSVSEINYPLSSITLNQNDSIKFKAIDDIYVGRINPLRFPCTYQVNWAGTQEKRIDFSLTLASASLTQAPGYRTSIVTDERDVVGYGKLLIPDFNGGATDTMDVLQIKVYHQVEDSFYLTGNPAPDSVLTALSLTQGSIKRDTFYVFYRADFSGSVLELNVLGDTITSAHYRPQAVNAIGTGITEKYNLSDMKYYPNPISAGQRLNINIQDGHIGAHQVMLMDMLGRQVSVTTLANQTTMQLEIPGGTPSGMYVILTTDATGAVVGRIKLQVQ